MTAAANLDIPATYAGRYNEQRRRNEARTSGKLCDERGGITHRQPNMARRAPARHARKTAFKQT